MIKLRHVGIYVRDIKREEIFYKQVFDMCEICVEVKQTDALIDDLLSVHETVKITKLITEQGKVNGEGDMIELVQYTNSPENDSLNCPIYKPGVIHIGFGIDDMDKVLSRIKELGGKQKTPVHVMENGNKCCFCQDPEGVWIELIERRSL